MGRCYICDYCDDLGDSSYLDITGYSDDEHSHSLKQGSRPPNTNRVKVDKVSGQEICNECSQTSKELRPFKDIDWADFSLDRDEELSYSRGKENTEVLDSLEIDDPSWTLDEYSGQRRWSKQEQRKELEYLMSEYLDKQTD